MINIKNLEESIKKLILPIVSEKKYKAYKSEELKELKIYTGLLPPDPEETILPAITIRTKKIKNSLEKKVLTIIISTGIFDKDVEKGYEEISELTQKIFDEIQKIGIIDDKFEILPEAEWEFPEEQPIPFYVSFIYINIVYEKDYRTDGDNWINGGD